MSKFSEWEFLLDGCFNDLRTKASELGSFYFNLYGGVDHYLDCPNDDFRMTTLYCEGETDPNAVWQIGYELVSLYNGASILLKPSYEKLKIVRLLHEGLPVDYVERRIAVGLLEKPPFSTHRIEEEYSNGRKTSIKYPLIHLATEYEDVYFILKYFDMDPGWITYYKLMEVLEGFAKSKGINLAVSKADRIKFTNTANNFSLSGFDSRHAFKQVVKENKTGSMKLDEGHGFVSGMAKSYLKQVYFPNAF